jgi:hypothetical protein
MIVSKNLCGKCVGSGNWELRTHTSDQDLY